MTLRFYKISLSLVTAAVLLLSAGYYFHMRYSSLLESRLFQTEKAFAQSKEKNLLLQQDIDSLKLHLVRTTVELDRTRREQDRILHEERERFNNHRARIEAAMLLNQAEQQARKR